MDTNYYVYIPAEDSVGKYEALHIGKSSSGWVFSLRIHPNRGINTLYDWMPVLLDTQNTIFIVDEYGRPVTIPELLRVITCRGRNEVPTFTQLELNRNQAVFGINNLLRSWDSKVHGEGTWDYYDCDFC